MSNVSQATTEYRRMVQDYLEVANSTNEALRNVMPYDYEKTRQKLQFEFEIQRQRLAMPPEVIHIDEIRAVLEMVRQGKKPLPGRGLK